MSRESEPARLNVFARDFANLFQSFAKACPNPETVTIADFKAVFDAHHVEYMHYCGGVTLDQPFFSAITSDLLRLSAAYLAIPSAATPRHARLFGLLLCLFLYSTQPARLRAGDTETERQPHSSVGSSAAEATAHVDTDANTGDEETEENEEVSAPSSPPVPASSQLPMQSIPISLGSMHALLAAAPQCAASGSGDAKGDPATPLSHTELQVVLTLHRARAWLVEPYTNDSVPIRALLAAHETCGVPLITVCQAIPPEIFAAQMAIRASSQFPVHDQDAGATNPLSDDMSLGALRAAYVEKRQRLLATLHQQPVLHQRSKDE